MRLSGTEALSIGSRLFRPSGSPTAYTPRRVYYGTVVDSTGQTIDDGIFIYMKAPHSFTGEDVVELQLHGSMVVLERVVERAIELGARCASPGEFTKRAFLNQKIDLLQAEAIIDLIRAKTERALRSARGRLEGRLSERIEGLKERLLGIVAQLEAELDFAEEDIEGLSKEQLLETLVSIEAELKGLIATYKEGRALTEGLNVVILGRPNVGKSTLLNLLLREERAIVTPQPGTTRDTIEALISVKGIPIRLVDTAGLRQTEDPVELIGIERAKRRAERAELILFVVDSSEEEGFEAAKTTLLRLKEELCQRDFIVVANKIDLVRSKKEALLQHLKGLFKGLSVVALSAKTEEGLEALEDAMVRALSRTTTEPEQLIVSLRHKEALSRALQRVSETRTYIDAHQPQEIITIELREALKELATLTGEVTTEDILDRIFSTFCIGK